MRDIFRRASVNPSRLFEVCARVVTFWSMAVVVGEDEFLEGMLVIFPKLWVEFECDGVRALGQRIHVPVTGGDLVHEDVIGAFALFGKSPAHGSVGRSQLPVADRFAVKLYADPELFGGDVCRAVTGPENERGTRFHIEGERCLVLRWGSD